MPPVLKKNARRCATCGLCFLLAGAALGAAGADSGGSADPFFLAGIGQTGLGFVITGAVMAAIGLAAHILSGD